MLNVFINIYYLIRLENIIYTVIIINSVHPYIYKKSMIDVVAVVKFELRSTLFQISILLVENYLCLIVS